jgi:hypothetical protein
MKLVRNGVPYEQLLVRVDGRHYRVTGTPDVAHDAACAVDVLREETLHGRRDRVRFEHWARIHGARRKRAVIEAALRPQRQGALATRGSAWPNG